MPMSSKFPAESTGKKNVKIGQDLAKIWTKYDSLVFWATLYHILMPIAHSTVESRPLVASNARTVVDGMNWVT